MKKTLFVVVVLVSFALGAFLFHTKKQPCPGAVPLPPQTITYHDTVTVPVIKTIIRPKYINRTDTITIYKNGKIDSSAVVMDYFSKRVYADTIINDTNAYVFVRDTVFQNRLISRKVSKQFFVHSYKVYPKIKRHFYLGAEMNLSKQSYGLAPGFLYQDKRQRIWQFNYDILQKQISIGAYFKIK